MNAKNIFEVFLLYLRSKIRLMLVLIFCTGIFSMIFYLYKLPLEASGYGFLLCFAFLFLFMCLGFWKFYERHLKLLQKRDNIIYGLEKIPNPENLIEEDYFELLNILLEEKRKIINESENNALELRDYYTRWAHQIKVPISALKLVLERSEFSERTLISNELFKIEQYAEMALYYTRLDKNSSDYVIKKYPLTKITKSAIKNYSRLFIRKNISLDYTETYATVTTDKKWLVFIIEQILSNAIKYTPTGGKIKIFGETAGKFYNLHIQDTGFGISAEDIPRIFEKGYTGFNGRSEKTSTGLGLYLCKRAADNLKISMSVKSEIKKGTTIILKIPI